MTEIIRPDLEKALHLFISSKIGIDELRAIINRSFFSSNQDQSIERKVIGELDMALAEFDHGICDQNHVLSVASLLLQQVRGKFTKGNKGSILSPADIPVHINVVFATSDNLSSHYTLYAPDVEPEFGEGLVQEVVAEESNANDYLLPTGDISAES